MKINEHGLSVVLKKMSCQIIVCISACRWPFYQCVSGECQPLSAGDRYAMFIVNIFACRWPFHECMSGECQLLSA